MDLKRKAYNKLLEWKKLYSDKYAALLEGAKRVGKSTIAESFAKNEYKSYILIDFSKTTSNILECFDDIANLNIFFLRLQAETGITLYEHESLIIFDEVQLFPKARQAVKHLVFDGRYSYLETGSLISIKKNVKDIFSGSSNNGHGNGDGAFSQQNNPYQKAPGSQNVSDINNNNASGQDNKAVNTNANVQNEEKKPEKTGFDSSYFGS